VIDRLPPRGDSAGIFASQAGALGVMIAFPDQPAALSLGSMLFGLCIGNVLTLPSVIIRHEWPPVAFGQLLGVSTAVAQVS
jgi:hypothetical protein